MGHKSDRLSRCFAVGVGKTVLLQESEHEESVLQRWGALTQNAPTRICSKIKTGAWVYNRGREAASLPEWKCLIRREPSLPVSRQDIIIKSSQLQSHKNQDWVRNFVLVFVLVGAYNDCRIFRRNANQFSRRRHCCCATAVGKNTHRRDSPAAHERYVVGRHTFLRMLDPF